MSIPYSLSYALKWPFLRCKPSIKCHSPFALQPASFAEFPNDQGPLKSIVFVGDLMCQKGNIVPEICSELRSLMSQAEIVIGNLEAPISCKENKSKSYKLLEFQISQAYVKDCLHAFSIHPETCYLNIANNHIADQGIVGFTSTIEQLKELGVTPFGMVSSNQLPFIPIKIAETQIGIVAWSHWLNKNSLIYPHTIYRTPEILEQDWLQIKKNYKIDLLLGYPHWEYEFQHFPQMETRRMAHHLINTGFDCLIGHHPHVIQAIEQFKKCFIFYSLGNCIAKQPAWPTRLLGVLQLMLNVEKNCLQAYHLHCFFQHNNGQLRQIVPISAIPLKLQKKVIDRLNLLFPHIK